MFRKIFGSAKRCFEKSNKPLNLTAALLLPAAWIAWHGGDNSVSRYLSQIPLILLNFFVIFPIVNYLWRDTHHG